jgi:hypothetical protein
MEFLMVTKNCACCGEPFVARPQVPNQAFCATPACQRERRQQWQRKKTNKMHNGLGALAIQIIRVITVQPIPSTRKKIASNNGLDRKIVRHWKSKCPMCQYFQTKYHRVSIELDISKQIQIAKQTCGLWR